MNDTCFGVRIVNFAILVFGGIVTLWGRRLITPTFVFGLLSTLVFDDIRQSPAFCSNFVEGSIMPIDISQMSYGIFIV